MSELLKEWVRTIFLTILVVSFIEIILPSGTMRKYLKFILSIIILAVILQPLLRIDEIDINAFEPITSEMDQEESNSDLIESVQQVQIINLFKQKLESSIINIIWDINSQLDIEEISINVFEDIDKKNFGEIHSINIILIGKTANEVQKTEIVYRVAEMLDIPKRKISLRIIE